MKRITRVETVGDHKVEIDVGDPDSANKNPLRVEVKMWNRELNITLHYDRGKTIRLLVNGEINEHPLRESDLNVIMSQLESALRITKEIAGEE